MHRWGAPQVSNFAVWINNDTEYDTNLAAVAAYLSTGDHLKRLPFMVWRDSSVQHFQVPPWRRCVLMVTPPWLSQVALYASGCWRPCLDRCAGATRREPHAAHGCRHCTTWWPRWLH